jgi:mannose-6-phosphate isomerase-like protein (cupin superfamily)
MVLNFSGLKNYVQKGWGYEAWIANSPLYCGKLLHIKQGKKISWHYHDKKDETFFITEGRGLLFYSKDDCMESGKFNSSLAEFIELNPGTTFHIPVGLRHRIMAATDLYVIEVSTEHFDEDSIRLEKGD